MTCLCSSSVVLQGSQCELISRNELKFCMVYVSCTILLLMKFVRFGMLINKLWQPQLATVCLHLPAFYGTDSFQINQHPYFA